MIVSLVTTTIPPPPPPTPSTTNRQTPSSVSTVHYMTPCVFEVCTGTECVLSVFLNYSKNTFPTICLHFFFITTNKVILGCPFKGIIYASLCSCSSDRSFIVDPLSYFSFQSVFHDLCNNGYGMCYPVCGMVHITHSANRKE